MRLSSLRPLHSVVRLLSSVLLLALPALAFAQGSLAPTGGPVPTMKTLDQLEPRTPLGAVGGSTEPITIAAPGSYVLLGNLEVRSGDAITITVANVSLDLGGYTIASTAKPAAGTAIRIDTSVGPTLSNVSVRNGKIADRLSLATAPDSGFTYGIYAVVVENVRVAEIDIYQTSSHGIALDNRGIVDHCNVSLCKGTAIDAGSITNCRATHCHEGIFGNTISNCHAVDIDLDAINAHRVASDCVGESIDGTGVYAHQAQNCIGASDNGTGLRAFSAATGCTGVTQRGVNGLLVGADGVAAGTAENCRGLAYGTGTGLSAETATNCYGESTSSTGLYAGTAINCSAIASGPTAALVVAGSATNCRGKNTVGGPAISAAIAVSCTSAGGSIDAPQKFLGTP